MARLAYIILAHESAGQISELAELLTKGDAACQVVIHYDKNSAKSEFIKLKASLAAIDRIHFVENRVRCAWGAFGLVDGVVRALHLIEKEKLDCDHVMLVSGSCMPIKPLAELAEFLDRHPHKEFIECFNSDWIYGGLREERYQYWHFFNFQTQHRLFNGHYHTQKKLWPKRRFPDGLEPKFGSQWWCLTWRTCEKILGYIKANTSKYRFFKTTWIPDEMFFQTMVFKTAPTHLIANRNLTFYHFNKYGKPLVFLDDHAGIVEAPPYFFARKISSGANKLRQHLAEIALRKPAENEGFVLPQTPYVFPYEELVANVSAGASPFQRLFPPPPKLLVNAVVPTNALAAAVPAPIVPEIVKWATALRRCPSSFVVFYGPPTLTRVATAALRGERGLTVLGRLFSRDMVDFGPGQSSFFGLNTTDHLIREVDPATYFTRVLDRTEGVLVFEMMPGENIAFEKVMTAVPNAVVIPIVPNSTDRVWQNLFWGLCMPPARWAGIQKSLDVYRAITDFCAARFKAPMQERLEAYLFGSEPTENQDAGRWNRTVRVIQGEQIEPFVDVLPRAAKAVRETSMEMALADMPSEWQQTFAPLRDLEPSWHLSIDVGRLFTSIEPGLLAPLTTPPGPLISVTETMETTEED